MHNHPLHGYINILPVLKQSQPQPAQIRYAKGNKCLIWLDFFYPFMQIRRLLHLMIKEDYEFLPSH
jgi:hypothetical protein